MSLSQSLVFGFACYLSLIALPALSLQLKELPNISTIANPISVNIVWLETPGDPPSINIQIRCGTISILQPPINAKTSVHGCFINNVVWNGNTFKGTCNIQAYDGETLLAEGPSFSAPPLPGAETPTSTSPQPTTTPPVSLTPPTSRPIPTISSTHVPVPASSTTTFTTQTTITTPIFSNKSSSLTTVSLRTTSNPPTTETSSSSVTTIGSNTQVTSMTFADAPSLFTSAIPVTTPITTTPVGASGSINHKKPIAAIVGGVVGGIIFLALVLGLLWLYFRRKRNRKNFVRVASSQSSPENNGGMRTRSMVSSFFTREVLDITPGPPVPENDYSQPEGTLGRFFRVQSEMLEAQRERDLLLLNLNHHDPSIHDIADAASENNLGGYETEMERELRQQYERLSALVLDLETQLREIELPPDYMTHV